MKSEPFIVEQSDDSKRLDLYISSRCTNYSRNFIQRCIRDGKVLVNGKQIKKGSYKLRQKDKIVLNKDFFNDTLRKNFDMTLKPSSKPLNIIYQDDSLIVVNKPAGICVYPSKGNTKDTLINRLIYKFSNLKNVGKENRFGLVHRIDKETSGVVLVALTNEALFFYSLQFEKRQVDKTYLAIVKGNAHGLFKDKRLVEVKNYLGRHHTNRKKMAVVEKSRGRFALTYFYFLATVKNPKLGEISLIAAKPKTGRTHQIRVHLSSLGFPIIGDKIYSKQNYDRMLLHAYKLKIKMLDGDINVFKADAPDEFRLLFNINDILREQNDNCK